MPEARQVTLELERLRQEVARLEGRLARARSVDRTELIVHWRPDFIRTFVNDAYCRCFGASREELLGRSVLDVVSHEHRAPFREKLARLTPEHPVEVAECRVLRPDGTTAWQQWIDRAVVEQGEVVELRSVGRDISERVALEGELRRAHTMEAIGLLAGGVAQDFNNLLLVVLTRVELARGAEDPSPHLDEIVLAANRAAKLNRQLLTLSRAQVLDLERVDLRDVLGRVLPLLRSLVHGEVHVCLERSAGACPVEVDVGRIDQVLIQLAANARDAMPEGGRLRIDVAPVWVEDGAELEGEYVQPPPSGPYVRLRVTDSGSGIDEEDLSRVFEPFFSQKSGAGLGLGLSSVWGIVRQHRGYVGVGNVQPHGALFELLIPREVKGRPSEPAGEGAERVAGQVLLVEDDDAVRRVMRTALETRGYAVTHARNAEEARRAVEGGLVPDLLVTDVVIPGIPGPALYRELGARLPGLRCLFVSGHAEEESVTELLGPSVAYLGKPFSFSELHEAIDRTRDTMSDSRPPG